MSGKNYCGWNLTEEKYRNFVAICNQEHTLIAGTTGSGKSVLLDDLLYVLTGYDPTEEQIILIDLKRVSFLKWRKFPHVVQLVTEPEDVIPCLDRIINQMERRYKSMMARELEQSRDCHIHVVIDELAQVLTVKGAEERIDQLLRLARAANIHLIMATQQPSRAAIPAKIWANVTCTVGLRCKNPIESRQVIGVKGCESLPHHGHAFVQYSEGLVPIDIPKVERWQVECQLEMYNLFSGIA